MTEEEPAIDVLVCAGALDVHRLLPVALKSCIQHFRLLKEIVVISSVPDEVRDEIARHDLLSMGVPIRLLPDESTLR